MKIAYLGAGTWGISLASLLAENGHDVTIWTRSKEFADKLQKNRTHPKLDNFTFPKSLQFTHQLEQALDQTEVIVESITSAGIRPVFKAIIDKTNFSGPIVLTSKGIEQDTGLLLPEVISELLGEKNSLQVGCLSGPSHAEEVIANLPTSVVCSAYDPEVMMLIKKLFTSPTFRVYPNVDILGVSFGGAMKNIIAIACGISDGLGFGDNTKAALMTRGLHEMRKLCKTKKCNRETLNGLSGMGDLCVTCLSQLSRNYRFGHLLAKGLSSKEAKEEIGMAVEGAYTCVSAVQLGAKQNIAIPISEVIYQIIYEDMNPRHAVKALLQRAIKEEHL